MRLADFSLLKEDYDYYTIGHPKGKSIKVNKKGLSTRAQELISQLKRHQYLAEGSSETDQTDETDQTEDEIKVEPMDDNKEEQDFTPPPVQAQAGPVMDVPSPSPTPIVDEPISQTIPQAPEQTALPNTNANIDQAIKSMEGSLAAEKEIGKKVGDAYGDTLTEFKSLPDLNALRENYKNQSAAYEKWLTENPINQNRYLEKMSTGSKIASAIGMLISGIGSGASGQTNLASKYLDNAINEDINAQKDDRTTKMNLWKMNHDVYKDEVQSYLATRNQMLTIAEVKAKQALAAAPAAASQGRLAPLILGLQNEKAKNDWMLSRVRSGPSGTEQQYISDLKTMEVMNPALHKTMIEGYLPGVGITGPGVKPSPKDKEGLNALEQLTHGINDAINFASNKAGTLGTVYGSTLNAEAENIRHNVVNQINSLHNLNRINENEYKSFLAQVPHPGTFFKSGAMVQLKNLLKRAEDRRNIVLKSLGVTPFLKSSKDLQALEWAKQNPNDPRAALVQKLGQK